MNLLVAANPGTFQPELPSPALIVVFTILLTAAFTLPISSAPLFDRKTRGGRFAGWAVLSAAFVAFAAVIVLAAVLLPAERASADEAQASYTADVIGWLESSYGVDVDAEQVERLLDGELIATGADGRTVAVITEEDGDLALVVLQTEPVKPSTD